MPPLLFEAAFHLDLDELRHNLVPIVTLAVPGVLITTLIIGGIAALGIGLPLTVAMVFGALLSATDPVSVVAFFRQLGAPRQLASIVEGESLFNDGTAVVVFRIALAIALSGQFNLVSSLTNFLWLAVGGLAVGGLLVCHIHLGRGYAGTGLLRPPGGARLAGAGQARAGSPNARIDVDPARDAARAAGRDQHLVARRGDLG
jgi:NhaP-type Na+/H+ or K+/H+ antiporter